MAGIRAKLSIHTLPLTQALTILLGVRSRWRPPTSIAKGVCGCDLLVAVVCPELFPVNVINEFARVLLSGKMLFVCVFGGEGLVVPRFVQYSELIGDWYYRAYAPGGPVGRGEGQRWSSGGMVNCLFERSCRGERERWRKEEKTVTTSTTRKKETLCVCAADGQRN